MSSPWLFTGSIGLDVIGARFKLQGALIDLDICDLRPFHEDEARAFIEELREQDQLHTPFAFAAGAFEKLARELGWLSPWYLRLLANAIRPSGPITSAGLAMATPADVEAAFDKLLPPSQRGQFRDMARAPREELSQRPDHASPMRSSALSARMPTASRSRRSLSASARHSRTRRGGN